MTILTRVSSREWADFLASQSDANLFQSPEMNAVYAATSGYRPRVFAVENHGKIDALMASTVIDYFGVALPALTSREVVTGGPIGNPRAFRELLGAHDRWSRMNSSITEIRNLRAPRDLALFREGGYEWEDHIDYLFQLDAGEQKLYQKMSKARRKGIASAERNGLQVGAMQQEDLGRAYGLLRGTYERAGLPLAHITLFSSALRILQPQGHLLVMAASLGDELCSVRFILRWDQLLFDWYAGSSDRGRSLHADELMVWRVMQKGIELGCTHFDFGGAGAPNQPYGPGEFKRRFGGMETNPGRFHRVYHPAAVLGARLGLRVRATLSTHAASVDGKSQDRRVSLSSSAAHRADDSTRTKEGVAR